ncbi:hypothetical protein FRB99_006184 [Tulasnella sp. 403]|nr:hypothetical protein FRB99_006184 [Tulasnella sp. 403]
MLYNDHLDEKIMSAAVEDDEGDDLGLGGESEVRNEERQSSPSSPASDTSPTTPSPPSMAYYAASSPPPPKAPSLAPTTNSEVTTPPPVEEKKKKSFAKRLLKEIAGGGGNNNGTKTKGAPTVRPYGRGGVGVKTSGAATSKTSLTSTSASSRSPTSSLNQHQAQAQILTPPPVPRHPPLPDDQRYDYYLPTREEYDDNQSTFSTIPAPKRTRQWIQQHSTQLPSPPNTVSGPPSDIYPPSGSGRDHIPNSPVPSQYHASQYSRNSDPQDSAYYTQYPGGYVSSPGSQGARPMRLQNVDEDTLSNDYEDQFGRLTINGGPPNSRAPHGVASPAASFSSRGRPGGSTISSFTARSPASQYAARYHSSPHPEDEFGDQSRIGQQHSVPAGMTRAETSALPHRSPNSANPQADPATAQAVERYLAQLGIPPGALDQLVQARSQQQAQTLQSEIEALREAERAARSRLDALRKDDPRSPASGSVLPRREDSGMSRLEAMGYTPSRASFSEASTPITNRFSGASTSSDPPVAMQNTGNINTRREPPNGILTPLSSTSPVGRTLSAQESAMIEKEKLRQRDLERERELREREREAGVGSAQGHYPPLPGMSPQATPGMDPLAALLAQSQLYSPHLLAQTLAAQPGLAGSSPAPPNPLAAFAPAPFGDPNQQQLVMRIQQLGALLMQQQQQLQALSGRVATTPPATADGGRSASPPSTVSDTKTPALPGYAAPIRLDNLRGVGSPFMSSFNRELGLGPSPTDDMPPNSIVGRGDGGRVVPPPRSSPPRVPLPELPSDRTPAGMAMGLAMMRGSPEAGRNSPSTPPPAYMSAR